jgi:UPF0716 protein FxsA
MLLRLLLLFVLVPLIELLLLVRIAQAIRFLPTVGIVILTGIIGSFLVRRQGLKTLQLIQTDLNAGRLPTDRILSGVLILVGGAFLITPGVITDGLGFLLMVPGNRRLLIRYLRRHFRERLEKGGGGVRFFHVGGGGPPGAEPPAEEITVEADSSEERSEA